LGQNGRGTGLRAAAAARRTVATARRTAAAAGLLCLLSGCGLIGTSKSSIGQAEQQSMNVTSPMVQQGVMLRRYTCHGRGESPPLSWSAAPAGTRSLALVVDDAAAPITPRLYWVVFDINPDTTDIQAGSLPTGARQAHNSTGHSAYDPPCPAGSPHQYRFTVYALNAMLRLPSGVSEKEAWTSIARHAIARGRLPVWAHP
jgi:Raf kinase inhibitor-like YbhB/YbcL family protein